MFQTWCYMANLARDAVLSVLKKKGIDSLISWIIVQAFQFFQKLK